MALSTVSSSEPVSQSDNQSISSGAIGSGAISDSSEQTPPSAGSKSLSKEDQEKYQKIQDDVDNGHEPGRLDPEEVAMEFASTTLKTENFSKSYDKIEKNVTEDHAEIFFKKDGKSVIKVKLYQPIKKGKGGIWVVTSWIDGKTNTEHTVG